MKAKTVLVVEDEMGPRESLKMILGSHYHVELAENGLRAVEILQKQKVDAVTLDLRMPGPSGIEDLKHIKSRWPSIQVLVITGYATLRTALDAIRHEAFHYLQNPFDIDELVDTMRRMILKKEQMEEMDFLVRSKDPSKNAVVPLSEELSPLFAASDFDHLN